MRQCQRVMPPGKCYVAGASGGVGSALVRALETAGQREILRPTRAELDLTDAVKVAQFLDAKRPEYVFLAAARVGGILANASQPADFLRDNLRIQTNVIDASYRAGVRRLIFFASSAAYPAVTPQPIPESALLTGPLDISNHAYAIAKIAGIEACRAYNRQHGTRFLTVMPCNLYGAHTASESVRSHVIGALLEKAHAAKMSASSTMEVWGTGTQRREFLHVDDLAAACLRLAGLSDAKFAALFPDDKPPIVNVGYGGDLSIAELAAMALEVAGHRAELVFDRNKPDGVMRKLLDSSRMRSLGWAPAVALCEGIGEMYRGMCYI